MKRIKIKSSAGKKTLFLPEWWGEVTTAQYQRLVTEWDACDLVKLFSIMSGIDAKVLSDTHDPDLEAALFETVRFVYDTKPIFKETKPPLFVTIEGKKIKIPRKLGSLSIGQNIMVRQRMDSAKTFDELISIVTAIYLQPFYDLKNEEIMKSIGTDFDKTVESKAGEFDSSKVDDLHEKVLRLPITETYPIGFFLLRPLMKSGTSSTNSISRMFTQLWQRFTRKGKTSPKWQKSQGLKEQGI